LRIHYLQHAEDEKPGSIVSFFKRRGESLKKTALFSGEPLPDIDSFDLLIVLGGPMGVRDVKKYPWLKEEKKFIRKAIKENKKVLGICLGAQLIASALGAKVYKGKEKEIGWFDVFRSPEAGQTPFHRVLPVSMKVFHWHGDTFEIPGGAKKLAGNSLYPNQGFAWEERVLALQFHLEMTPDSAALMVDKGRSELEKGGSHVQTGKEIKEKGEVLFERNNRILDKLLEVLTRDK
jgi:GMP synthase (glutamine-hydrolysing)